MHRASLKFRTCQRPRFGRNHSASPQSLSKTGPHDLLDEDGTDGKRRKNWEQYRARRSKRKDSGASNVRVEDLPETLDIHRDENRAKVLRKINAPEDTLPYVRPLFLKEHGTRTSHRKDTAGAQHNPKNPVNDHPIEQTQKGEAVGSDSWPADSLQAQEARRRNKRKSPLENVERYVKKGDVLEYIGKSLPPSKFWAYHPVSLSSLDRPWLVYMEKPSGSGSERFVMTNTFLG